MIYPKITIVTPSYNQGKYIEETILSIINQKYPNLEYIIIDGGSTDNTVEIIKKYAPFIDYWISEKDSGQTNAINKGIAKATGDLFNWINSDDKLEIDSLFEIANIYNSNTKANVIIGQTIFFNTNNIIGKSGPVLFSNTEKTIGFGQINQPATYYKTDVLKKIYPLNERYNYCMDLDLWIKYLLKYGINEIVITKKVLALFRLHDESKTMGYQEQFSEEKKIIYDKLAKENPSNIYTIKKRLIKTKAIINYYLLWKSDELSLQKKNKESLKTYLKINPLLLDKKEYRRYFAIIKNIIKNKISPL